MSLSKRLKFYSDAECNILASSFSFGDLNEGESKVVRVFLKNMGMVPVENVSVQVGSKSPYISVTQTSVSKIKSFKPRAVHKIVLKVSAFEDVKAGDVQIDIEAEGGISSE